MNTDPLKREFIRYMEETHSTLLFPRKFFGCLMAVFIEQKPVTQDRIEQLTKYSKTTISQMLKIIQMNFPLRGLKKLGIRKKFYVVDIHPEDFMLFFFQMIINSYKNRVDFVQPLLKGLEPYVNIHSRFQNFYDFLENFYSYSTLYLNLLTDTTDDLTRLFDKNHSAPDRRYLDVLDKPENLLKIQKLLAPPKIDIDLLQPQIPDNELKTKYSEFKEQFYRLFRENLILAQSQTEIARVIVGTELLLERRPLIQKEIQQATKFQRSTISESLKMLQERQMVQLLKKPGDRKKYYVMIQSWDRRTVTRIKLNTYYASEVKSKIEDLLEQIKSIQKTSNEIILLSSFFEHLYNSYTYFEQYFNFLERKYLSIRLEQEFNNN